MIGTPSDLIDWLMAQDGERLFEVRERRTKRTLTQNAYYWALLNRLARTLGYSDDEVHRTMLRLYGQADVFSVRVDVPLSGYLRYYDEIGRGWLNGKEYRHVRAYKGSSEMDRAEFSKLLEGMRYECEQQGIPVMTPAEIAVLDFTEAS